MKKHLVSGSIALISICLFLVKGDVKEASKDIESFSISLNVKDIKASKAFYEKLGFEAVPDAGAVAQKWIIMQNGKARIGLFQGFFPSNTITINPTDARSIYNHAKKEGLQTVYAAGMDKEEGPASFALVDPDGNSILIDQHK